MKPFAYVIVAAVSGMIFLAPGPSGAGSSEFSHYEMGFKNFVTCELTRTDATSHFKGQPFTITMIDLFSIRQESDLVILSGAVQCFIQDHYQTLYIALGIQRILDRETVSYYVVKKKNFSIHIFHRQ
jgi:hypothetical protein